MKYMLMMTVPFGRGDYQINQWPTNAFDAHVAFMFQLSRDLSRSGELVTAQGLAGPQQAKIVRHAESGPPVVSDGPFPEMKEFLAGYWIVEVGNPQRAYEIAALAHSFLGLSSRGN